MSVVVADAVLSEGELDALVGGVEGSALLGESTLGGTFLPTRGFSITFHRRKRAAVVERFPFLAPFLRVVLDDIPAHRVAPRRWLRRAPVPNALYVNVLSVPPGAAVGRHVDATLGPPDGSVVPLAVSVLYVDVPDGMRGGRLRLFHGDALLREIEPKRGQLVVFAGQLGHEVTAVDADRPRLSVVCEQYALPLGVLSAVPSFKLQSNEAFRAVLERSRRSMLKR